VISPAKNGVRPSRGRPPRARYEGFQAYIKRVGTGPKGSRDLSFEEARAALGAILDGRADPAQTGAFLVASRIKGEAPEEIAGFAAALRERSRIQYPDPGMPVVACAGGYDGVVDGPQLSLAVAAIAAASGAAIALHGAPPLGPKHGTTVTQVLEALGLGPALEPEASALVLERTGIGVFWTPLLCPPWEALRPLRDAIGVRTPLNAAEKLLAPVACDAFVAGVTHLPYALRLLEALRRLDAGRALVVRGLEGSDVAKPGRPRVYELAHGEISETDVGGGESLPAADAATAGAEGSARLTRELVSGLAPRDVTGCAVLSAGLRLYAAGVAASPSAGSATARAALESGAAADSLAAFIEATREVVGAPAVAA